MRTAARDRRGSRDPRLIETRCAPRRRTRTPAVATTSRTRALSLRRTSTRLAYPDRSAGAIEAAAFEAARERAEAIRAPVVRRPDGSRSWPARIPTARRERQGGNLGQLTAGTTTPEFERALLGLEVGEISRVVETPIRIPHHPSGAANCRRPAAVLGCADEDRELSCRALAPGGGRAVHRAACGAGRACRCGAARAGRPQGALRRRAAMATTAERIRTYRGPAILSYGFRPFFLLGAIWAALVVVIWLPLLAGRSACRRHSPQSSGTCTSWCMATCPPSWPASC